MADEGGWVMDQLTMTGEDWLSERERSRDRTAKARLNKAELKAAKALHAAADALDDWMRAYCEVHPDKMGLGDQRRRLSADCRELASYVEGLQR